MIYLSEWFPLLYKYRVEFLDLIHSNRFVNGWQDHISSSGIPFRSLYHSYSTKDSKSCIIESHRHTIDLQYCYSGGEKISYADPSLQKSHVKYLPESDKDIWTSDLSSMSSLLLTPSSYVLFRPNELHCPQQNDGSNPSIEKIVLKLPVAFLS